MSVVLVDDHAIIREGVKAILAADPDISVIGEGGSLEALHRLLDTLSPDIVLLDMSMEEEDSGFTALRTIGERSPRTRVIMLSVFSQVDIVRKALQLGANGYVCKHEAASHILHAVRAVAEGDTYVTPNTVVALIGSQDAKDSVCADSVKGLTRREEEILRLVGDWHSTKEIADMLHISSSTVGTHMENIKEKLGFSSKHALIQYALSRVLR